MDITNNKPKIKNINLETRIPNFIHKLVLYEKNNFIGLNIKNEVIKYFKIIGEKPNFLVSYFEYKKMPIRVLDAFKNEAHLYKSSFKLFRDYCLLLLTNEYISNNNDFKTCENFTFKGYVSGIYAKNSNEGQADKVTDEDKYANVLIYNKIDFTACTIPLMATINTFYNIIIFALKNTISLLANKFSAIYDSSWRNSKKYDTIESYNIANFCPTAFSPSEHISKIMQYPFCDVNKKWFESIIGLTNVSDTDYPQFMHEYMMKLKYTLKYNGLVPEKIDYYAFIKKYQIPKRTQNKLLQIIEKKNPTENLYLNKFGNLCENNCWTTSDIFNIVLNSKGYVIIDILMLNNKMVWNNSPNTIKLLQDCYIQNEHINWLIPKLKETDFSNTNIYETLNLYNSQIKLVTPSVTDIPFSALSLKLKDRGTILKKFLEGTNKNIHIDSSNNLIEYKQIIILVKEPIPEITKITFDMQYCLLCEKFDNKKVLECNYGYIVEKSVTIKQPHFCDNCFNLITLIKRPPTVNNETRVKINNNIVELSFICEKFSLMLFGIKYDDKSTLNMLVPDILQTIVSFYIPLLNF